MKRLLRIRVVGLILALALAGYSYGVGIVPFIIGAVIAVGLAASLVIYGRSRQGRSDLVVGKGGNVVLGFLLLLAQDLPNLLHLGVDPLQLVVR